MVVPLLAVDTMAPRSERHGGGLKLRVGRQAIDDRGSSRHDT